MSRCCSLPLLALVLLTGCYRQVVRTGASPGPVVIERPWTATYIFGLVAAQPIRTAAECPSGIAIVETQQSFLNGLVGVLTFGIYTPQTVTITCAGDGTALQDTRAIQGPAGANGADEARAMRAAVGLAQQTGERVVVHSGR